jgi:hypothetical protein
VQAEKADAGEEDEAAQPGGPPVHQLQADEIGEPDFPQNPDQVGSRAVNSDSPKSGYAARVRQYNNGGLSRYGAPFMGGVSQVPASSISWGIRAYMAAARLSGNIAKEGKNSAAPARITRAAAFSSIQAAEASVAV